MERTRLLYFLHVATYQPSSHPTLSVLTHSLKSLQSVIMYLSQKTVINNIIMWNTLLSEDFNPLNADFYLKFI